LVVELAADYQRHLKEYHGAGATSEWHRLRPIVRPLCDLYGRTPAAEFGPLQLKSLRQKFVALGWSRSYVNHNVRRLVRMFRWAVSEGRVSPLVPQALAMVAGLRKGKSQARETDPVEPVDDAIVDATLPFMPDVPADMVRFQRLTGCRPAEVCIIRPCDVDRSGDVWLYRPQHHKTEHHGRGRTVLIGPKAQAVLIRYLAREAEMYCFRPCDSMSKHFAARRSARVTPDSCGNKPGSHRSRRPRKTPGLKYKVDAYRRAIARGLRQIVSTSDARRNSTP
jgi:integrase